MESLADEFAGRVRIVKVDVEEDDPVLDAFAADGVPAYIVFRDGVEVDRFEPFLVDWGTEGRLRRRITAALEAGA